MKSKITLDGHSLTLEAANTIAYGGTVSISPKVTGRIKHARKIVDKIADGEKAVYGVNTGFGFLANKQIPKPELRDLQENILTSHAAGYGAPFSIPETRLALVLRLNSLIKGLSGARLELCQQILKLVEAEIYPIVPEYGSLGASGDLIPLAHLGLPLIGLGPVRFKGKVMQARAALKQAKIEPLELAPKEGLSFVNGTEMMQSVGALALYSAHKIAALADLVTALSFEAMEALLSPLAPFIHSARGQRGQIKSAKAIRSALKGSYLQAKSRTHKRVQDPYSLRCSPQIHGPTHDALEFAKGVVEREINGVTDNPLVNSKTADVVSGGNFHGQALAMVYDFACIACAELASVSERRLELMCNPHTSNLPPFLSENAGTDSGYMALQYLSGSLVNENRILAHPACIDSIPGNVGIEDHVSMGMTAARKLKKVVDNAKVALAIEALAACQAIDLRGQSKLGKGTALLYRAIRKRIPMLKRDRFLQPEIDLAVSVIEDELLKLDA
ncbi:MAG: histidine ammonia-lyase [Bdellovibrionales bacterium]|nr:histidine ammonia-lyase [Bdellovibrionales bacterium]